MSMNREIKFRAWDRENKKMIYDFANFSSGNVIDVPEGRWSHELRLTNKNEIKASLNFKSNDTFETKRIEYIPTMQFTGLKDKNGVEIFEGDVVRFTNSIDEIDNEVGKVTWEQSECNFVAQYKTTNRVTQEENGTTITIYLISNETYREDVEYEVIGNIYENPELLEVES